MVLFRLMYRSSKQKKAILRVLMSTISHPTADWIYQEVRKEIPHISLGTVYRDLRLLTQNGQVLQLNHTGTLSRFDGNTQPHNHFTCERCGQVFDVSIDEPRARAMMARTVRRTGFRIDRYHCEFYGVCKECQNGSL